MIFLEHVVAQKTMHNSDLTGKKAGDQTGPSGITSLTSTEPRILSPLYLYGPLIAPHNMDSKSPDSLNSDLESKLPVRDAPPTRRMTLVVLGACRNLSFHS